MLFRSSDMPLLSPGSARPRYVQIAQALIEDIAEARQPIGSLLPTEHALCRQFGASRHTVREAIRLLQERGLVTRQRGVGTCVKAVQSDNRYVQSTMSIADLMHYVEDTRLVTSGAGEVMADTALAKSIGCALGQRWMRVSGMRFAGAEKLPMALTEIHINPLYGAVRELIGVLKVPVCSMIESQYGVRISEVQQDIRAVVIAAVDAQRLQVKPGSAGLLITRRYLDANAQVIEVAINLHPADRFSYAMSLRLRPPAA